MEQQTGAIKLDFWTAPRKSHLLCLPWFARVENRLHSYIQLGTAHGGERRSWEAENG